MTETQITYFDCCAIAVEQEPGKEPPEQCPNCGGEPRETVVTNDEEHYAYLMKEKFDSAFDKPENWDVDTTEDFPHPECTVEGFPDDYKRQYEVAGYWINDDFRVGVWWLRDGEQFQVFYDSPSKEKWSEVGDAEYVAEQLSKL